MNHLCVSRILIGGRVPGEILQTGFANLTVLVFFLDNESCLAPACGLAVIAKHRTYVALAQ